MGKSGFCDFCGSVAAGGARGAAEGARRVKPSPTDLSDPPQSWIGSPGASPDPRSGWHPHRLNSADWVQVAVVLKPLGPCTSRQRFGAVLAGGKDAPTNSGTSGARVELHWGGARRQSREGTPHIQNSPAAVRGPLDASGLLSVDRKGERNQRFWSPRRRKVMPSMTSSLDKGCPAGARCSGKRARGRGRAGKPSGIMP